MKLDITITITELGLDVITTKLDQLIIQGDTLMSNVADNTQKLEALTVAITEERAEVQGLLTGLRTQVQTLQDQVAAGAVASQADLDAFGAALDAALVQVRAISEPQA